MSRPPALMATAANGDDGINNPLMSDVLGTHEKQVWFLAEHQVDMPLVRP